MISKLLAAAVAALLMFPAFAHANTTGAVIVYGKARPQQRDVVGSTIAQALRAAAWTVSDAPLSQEERDAIVKCAALARPWPCVADTAKAQGLDRIVVIQVDPDPDKTDKDVVLTGQILHAGDAVAATDRGWCTKCTDAALVTSAGELVNLLLARASARNARAKLTIRTVPSGAVITMDGAMVGETDRTFTTTPGPHTVLLQRSGYKTESRSIVVAEDKPATIEVALVAAESNDGANTTPSGGGDDREPSRVVPGILIGVGAIALVGGAVVSYRTNPPNTFEQSPSLYNGYAIGASVIGGATLAAGLYLWFRPSGSSTSTPTVAPASGGAVVGWARNW